MVLSPTPILLTTTLSLMYTLSLHPTQDFKHKAFSQEPQQMDWKKAVNKEGKLIWWALEAEHRENRRKDEEMKKLQAEMEKDQDTAHFQDHALYHQARALELKLLRERFHVENKDKKDKLTDSQITKYEMMMNDYFD